MQRHRRAGVGAIAALIAVTATAAGCSDAPAPVGPVRLTLTAEAVAFDRTELAAPAGRPFVIELTQKDPQILHNVEIRTQGGRTLFSGTAIDAGQIAYQVEALPAGVYTFVCTVHPIPTMTGSLVVR